MDGADDQTPITVVKADLERGYYCSKCQGLKREHELAVRQACLCADCARQRSVETDQKGNSAANQKYDPVAQLIW